MMLLRPKFWRSWRMLGRAGPIGQLQNLRIGLGLATSSIDEINRRWPGEVYSAMDDRAMAGPRKVKFLSFVLDDQSTSQ